MRNVHWLHALVTATSMVSFGPSSSNAAKSTAYDTDIVEPLLASGKLTLNAEVMADVSRRSAKSGRSLNSECGPSHTTRRAPIAIVAPTYKRAGSGRERMCAVLYLRTPHRLGPRCPRMRETWLTTRVGGALGGASNQDLRSITDHRVTYKKKLNMVSVRASGVTSNPFTIKYL